MSATSSACATPRLTALAWCTMASSVTGRVLSWPSAAIPTESPTRTTSTPAPSSRRAVGVS